MTLRTWLFPMLEEGGMPATRNEPSTRMLSLWAARGPIPRAAAGDLGLAAGIAMVAGVVSVGVVLALVGA